MSFTFNASDPKLVEAIRNVGKQKPLVQSVVSEVWVRTDNPNHNHGGLVQRNLGREGQVGVDADGTEFPDVTILHATHTGDDAYRMAYHIKNKDGLHELHVFEKGHFADPSSHVVKFSDQEAKHLAAAFTKGE